MQASYKELLQARVGAFGGLPVRGTMLSLLSSHYQVIHSCHFTTRQGARTFGVQVQCTVEPSSYWLSIAPIPSAVGPSTPSRTTSSHS